MCHNHHAYRSKLSTTTNLIQLMDTIATATDGNLITATMSLDLSVALDCMEHGILLQKISYYGFDRDTVDWIRSYLSHRSGYVAIGSGVSSIKSTPHGVPQGSVIGPLLYLLYVNEMLTVIEDNLCMNPNHNDKESLFKENCNNLYQQ